MPMDDITKLARRRSGIARFERNCRCITGPNGRKTKAYRVPGTREQKLHEVYQFNTLALEQRLWLKLCT